MNDQQRAAMQAVFDKANAVEIDSDECLDFDECTAMLVPLDSYNDLIEAITALREALRNASERMAQPSYDHAFEVVKAYQRGVKDAQTTAPPVVPQGEPVYYQWRRKNQPWSIRHVYHNKVEATTDDSEVRELYTTLPSVEAAIEATKEKAAKVCDSLYKHDRKESGYDEGWNDALDIAGQLIAGTLTMEDVK